MDKASFADQRRDSQRRETAHEWLETLIGMRIDNETDLKIFLGCLGTVVKAGGDEILNQPLSPRILSQDRRITKGDTPLDYYTNRAAQLEEAVNAERDGEASGDGEAVSGTRLAYCQEVIKFLENHGAKLSKGLS